MKKLATVLVVLSFALILSGCRDQYFGDYRTGDFEHINHWEDFEKIGEDQVEVVYIYNRDFKGTFNIGSREANEEVFRFGMENELGLNMILINSREMQGQRPHGVDRYQPQLLLVNNGVVTERETGATHILRFIESLENEEYELPGIENDDNNDETNDNDE